MESGQGDFRNIVCYLVGEDNGNNGMEQVADVVIYLNLKGRSVSWRSPSLVRRLCSIIDDNKVSLIDCHMWRAMPLGVLSSVLSEQRPRCVGVFHGVKGRVSLRDKLLYYFVLKHMERVVSVSEGGKEEILARFWGVTPDKLVAIPNGLDFSGLLDLTAGDRTALFGERLAGRRIFLTASRLAVKKNLARLIRAFKGISEACPDAGLAIVGGGREEKKLRALVDSLGLSDAVEFLGFRQDVAQLMQSADVYVIPSLYEGLPRSLLEAMALGKPVLASRISGQKEVVADLQHGRLVDPLSIEDMTEGFRYFMEQEECELNTLGSAAQAHVLENFNREGMMQRYRQLFLELTS